MNYRMVIQYDGSRYRGWQRQRHSMDTIQGRIENVLSRHFGRGITIDGAGRTDAGVHALAQVANVHLEEHISVETMKQMLNVYLPEDIRILRVEMAGERFHSRLNATGKTYEYHLAKEDCYDVFRRKYSWQMTEKLDVDRMREAAKLFLGKHDFCGFCSKASKKKSTVRRIDAVWVEENATEIILRLQGNGFLYNMVRIITGTLVEIGRGERDIQSIITILQNGDRRLAGETAPAQGLFLAEVKYD